MKRAIKTHLPCQACGSSDALSVYDDHSYCFSCQNLIWQNTEKEHDVAATSNVIPTTFKQTTSTITDNDVWYNRNISKAVTDFYFVRVLNAGTRVEFPYYANGEHSSKKVREVGKDFFTEGDFASCDMFGSQTLAKAKHNTIIVTEGEGDALAAFQMANRISPEATSITNPAGSIVPVLSIKSGASGAERDFKTNLELLEKFERVFICFDSDDPGKVAADRVAKLLSPGKAYIVSLERKDACEYTKHNLSTEFLAHLKSATVYTPSGICNAGENFDSLWNETNVTSIPFPFAELQEKTLGVRAREIVTWAAGTGVGKSSLMRELQHYYLKNTAEDTNIGIIALEESTDRTRRGILAVEANDKLHINEVFLKYSKDQIKKYFDATLGTGRVFLYDHFGSMEIEDLLARVRYMVVGLDCKLIFIDHLSILVSGLDISDERKAIDRTMTLLRKLTEETGCTLHLVTHLRRMSNDRSHEEGEEISLNHLRGSHGIAQISDTVVALERDTQNEDPILANTTTLRVLKCRYTGDVGRAGALLYDRDTGRLTETTIQAVSQTNTGGHTF
jgi:twinkle protein